MTFGKFRVKAKQFGAKLFTPLEISILNYAQDLIQSEFGITDKEFFHYTNLDSAKSIIQSQIFESSFIRSSSDTLEFCAPLAACRDCVCLTKNFFDHQSFPTKWFKHFNEEAASPTARAYFISLSADPNSALLKSMYGDQRLRFHIVNESQDFKTYGFFIKCRYVDDTRKEIFRLLRRWKEEVLTKAFDEHGVKDPSSIFKIWFYTLMQFCHTISVATKQDSFSQEDETRIVVFPRNPDDATEWHQKRKVKQSHSNSLIPRELLPLKMKAMGIVVSHE